MVAVLFTALLASPIAASSYDPHRPPWGYILQNGDADSGDDGGWVEVDAINPPSKTLSWSIFGQFGSPFRFFTIGIVIVSQDTLDDNGNEDPFEARPNSGSGSR